MQGDHCAAAATAAASTFLYIGWLRLQHRTVNIQDTRHRESTWKRRKISCSINQQVQSIYNTVVYDISIAILFSLHALVLLAMWAPPGARSRGQRIKCNYQGKLWSPTISVVHITVVEVVKVIYTWWQVIWWLVIREGYPTQKHILKTIKWFRIIRKYRKLATTP